MATKQIIEFGKLHSSVFFEPVLEIGSKIYPNYTQFSPRTINSQNSDYLGIDIAEGSGDNFLIVKNGKVISPEGRNILRGISRSYVMNELCSKSPRVISVGCLWYAIPISVPAWTPLVLFTKKTASSVAKSPVVYEYAG